MPDNPRAAIYARYSDKNQSDRSIEDQFTLCSDYAAREGLTVVRTYEDRALSGASTVGRDGIAAMLADARDGAFDVLIVESLDRLARDMEDLPAIYKRLKFTGIETREVFDGIVTTMRVGLRGLIGQIYLEDNAHKVRRGLAGRVKDGLIAGGITYGYAPVKGELGRRVIVEAEAGIVRRVFAEYIAGSTPREIAYSLNRDKLPSPRGAHWNASTIHGNPKRGSGILHNELYAGRLIWNRVRMIKDPDTGRRVSRANPPHEWFTAEMPDLAIVTPDIFATAKARRKQRGEGRPEQHRRAKHLLSGLLRCGSCGGGMTACGTDKSGRKRIRCSNDKENGRCPEPKTFYLHTVEAATLDGLKAELKNPAAMAAYVRLYDAERRRLAADTIANRANLERRLAAVSREADKITDYLIKGTGDPTRLDKRAKELMTEEQALKLELSQAPEPPKSIALHPALITRYENQLKTLGESLGKGITAGDTKAAEALRDLVETVTVHRDARGDGAVTIEITGRLNALIGDPANPAHGLCGRLVAAGRYARSAQLELRYKIWAGSHGPVIVAGFRAATDVSATIGAKRGQKITG